MIKKNRTSCMIITLMLWGVAPALAQTAPATHMPLEKAVARHGRSARENYSHLASATHQAQHHVNKLMKLM